MQPDLDYLQTTQLYRPARRAPAAARQAGRWAPAVAGLLAAGYSFLPCGFADGYLFRGMDSGLGAAMAAGSFGWFDGEDELAAVERAMGVYFLSSEPADAISVARLASRPADAAVVAVPAAVFGRCLEQGAAAVLAVGDGGLVFRYPLLTAPLAAADVACLFVCDPVSAAVAAAPAWRERIVNLGSGTRRELEDRLVSALRRRGLDLARPVPAIRPAFDTVTGGSP